MKIQSNYCLFKQLIIFWNLKSIRYELFSKSLLFRILLKERRLSLAQHSHPHCLDVEAENEGEII